MSKAPYPNIPVGRLKDAIAGYPDDYTIDFSGLEFNRIKQRGDTHLQLEFMEQVYRDEKGDVVVQNLE